MINLLEPKASKVVGPGGGYAYFFIGLHHFRVKFGYYTCVSARKVKVYDSVYRSN